MLRRAFAPLATARTWRETTHLLLDLPMGIAWFTVTVTLMSMSIGLAITVIGLPLLAATILVGRSFGVVDRWRASVLLDTTILMPQPYRLSGTLWQKMRTAFGDRPGWKGLLYGVIMLPWGVMMFGLTVTVWATAWAMTLFPTFAWASPDDQPFGPRYVLTGWGRVGSIIGVSVVGVVLLALTPRLVHAMAMADAWLVRLLLSRGREEVLEERVSELRESRDASVESAAGELRRIERDLHDGAQQRLVGLAMDLGIAKDHLRASNDPKAIELVGRAHDEAKHAIVELRDLVRGIHPAVLTDRGLDAAVSGLVARCPVPVDLHSDLPRRLSPAVEATAYFVVAEALTNVAKHSGARRATVRLAEVDGRLLVDVTDDGHGGALDSGGGGLGGLRDRVHGAEGQLVISSPAGGPTSITVELPVEQPCES